MISMSKFLQTLQMFLSFVILLQFPVLLLSVCIRLSVVPQRYLAMVLHFPRSTLKIHATEVLSSLMLPLAP